MIPFGVSIARLRTLARGQTMAEYAMILATIALITAALYNTAGVIVTGLLAAVDSLLK